ncbi:hypothetical protein ACLB2K_055686 [Fragaria x ananassa]
MGSCTQARDCKKKFRGIHPSQIHLCLLLYLIQKRSEADVRTLSPVRTSLCSSPDGSDDGAPPPEWTPKASPITFPYRQSAEYQFAAEIDLV